MSVFIGTSGYDYPEWKGSFYPQELKRKDFLSYYSEIFNTVELNYSFYSMPKKDQMVNFYDRSDGKINFNIKANRLLTHEIGTSWKESAKEFKDSIFYLAEKAVLGNVLFQFPQSFHYVPENRLYLASLISEFEGFPVVVEFRHREWIRESVLEGLDKRRAGIVFCDMPELKHLPSGFIGKETVTKSELSATPFIGDTAYIRLHGRNADAWYVNDGSANGSSRYDYDYSDEELMKFVPVIVKAKGEGKKVFVLFNNHPNGNGANNAKTLKNMLQRQ